MNDEDNRMKNQAREELVQVLFKEFDEDNSNCFSRVEFQRVIKSLALAIGAERPIFDDIQDLFNLLDVNGDEQIDHRECISLIKTFFLIVDKEEEEAKKSVIKFNI